MAAEICLSSSYACLGLLNCIQVLEEVRWLKVGRSQDTVRDRRVRQGAQLCLCIVCVRVECPCVCIVGVNANLGGVTGVRNWRLTAAHSRENLHRKASRH